MFRSSLGGAGDECQRDASSTSPTVTANALASVDSDASANSTTQATERIRVQELLRYLQPYEADPPLSSKARVATDTTLTAFAQLSALRLNCERAFISLMDASHQYIVAEATRSLSLKSEDVHDHADDALFLGQTILDFDWGVCPGTIACFTSPDDSLNVTTDYVKATRAHYVMNDMSVLEDFKGRPYIAGWPYMKYYAEVPIHSPTGLTIGTLCVVDNKPREGLDMKGLEILREISEAVMNHLELCVSKIQRNNAERMIHALGGFVQGSDSVRNRWLEAQATRFPEPGQRHLSIAERAKLEFDGYPVATIAKEDMKSPGSATLSPDIISSAQSDGKSTNPREATTRRTTSDTLTSEKVESETSNTTIEVPGHNAENEGTEQSDSLTQLEGLLARATNLIREGIGLDGVVFLDPRSTDGMLLTDINPAVERSKWRPSRSASDVHLDEHEPPAEESRNTEPKRQRCCKILGSSLQRKNELPQVEEQTLQYVLQDFRNGGILHYDDEGLIGENDTVFIWDKPESRGPPGHTIRIPKDKTPANKLRDNFPGATSIMLFPFWDMSHDKLLGYSIAWTTNPNRVFQREDFAYLAAFGNSVMAEVARLDVAAADKAKAGFISSISHELRSPLHGIMAGVELLHDLNNQLNKDNAASIIRTIESCGSTLLETMDNLLTFTKVATALPEKQMITEVVDLAGLVEDVVRICIMSQSFHESAVAESSTAPRDLTVVCDTQTGVNWLVKTNAGIWKRVLLNLLGNAMKYTKSGVIQVKLSQQETTSSPTVPNQIDNPALSFSRLEASTQQEWLSRTFVGEPIKSYFKAGASTSVIVLSVEDTGKGISPDYMAHHMFKPFYQEDNMSPGTGLGLSIVSQLMSSIDGTTTVSSEVGAGTSVRVKCPVECSDTNQPEPFQFSNRKIGFVGLDVMPEPGRVPNGILDSRSKSLLLIRSLLLGYAEDLGLSITKAESTQTEAEIIITTESASSGAAKFQRLMVVLAAEPVLHTRDASKSDFSIVLSQPFGARAFRQALDEAFSKINASKSLIAPSLPIRPAISLSPQPSHEIILSPAIQRPPTLCPSPNTTEPFTLLLVDDNAINLRILIALAKKMKLPYLTATNGLEAVEIYQQAPRIDVILMDLQMPVMTGIEANQTIRKLEREEGRKRVDIFVLTASALQETKQEALDSGADRYFGKPMLLRDLAEAVKVVFEREGF